MSKSLGLRGRDVQAAYRLIAECRELGADAQGWRQHLAQVLRRLCGAKICTVAEFEGSPAERMQQFVAVSTGGFEEEPDAWPHFLRYRGDMMALRDPAWLHISRSTAPRGTLSPEQVVGKRPWFSSVVYNEYLRLGRCDFSVYSFAELPGGSGLNMITLFRGADSARFTTRDRRLLDLIHEELARLLGGPLATAREPGLAELSPRLRETLECLLNGDSEKQVALRLGISPRTVHEYVASLHRHFGVSSRGELLAHFLRRFRWRPGQAPTD